MMLLASLGSPSALAYATANIMRSVSDQIFGGHSYIQAMYLKDFRDQWSSQVVDRTRGVVFFSDCPHHDIIELMANTRSPIVMVAEDFPNIVSYVMRARNMEFAPAIRFASQVACSLERLSTLPHVLRITTTDYESTLVSYVERLISFFGAPCSQVQFSAILTTLAPPTSAIRTIRDYVGAHFPLAHDPANLDMLTDEQLATLASVGSGYDATLRGLKVSSFFWPRSLFLDWDKPGAFLSRPIELVGPARFIICGPYLHLPRGAWQMKVEIETKDCFSDNGIGADIFSEQILTRANAKLPPSGRYGFELDFNVADVLAPVEIRIQTLTGSIEGQINLVSARLESRDEDQ